MAYFKKNYPLIAFVMLMLFGTSTSHAQKIPISPELATDLEELAKEEVQKFWDFLGIIVDNPDQPEMQKQAVQNALKLFAKGAYNKMEVINRGIVAERTIGEYLRRLILLSQTHRVTITAEKFEVMSELEQQADGTYRGSIATSQTFTIVKKDGTGFTDKDIKITDIIFTATKNPDGTLNFVLKLGDTTVDPTKSTRTR